MGVADYDAELFEAVKDLDDQGILPKGHAAYGIAQQVIHDGYDSLSVAQRAVYDRVVVPALKSRAQELASIQHMNAVAKEA